MAVSERLIKLGWVDTAGRMLSWKHWKQPSQRCVVAYWRDITGQIEPIYNIFASQMVNARKAK